MHALYIHWPFCRSKCPYCDFNSHVRESVDQPAWREALIAELRWYAGQSLHTPLPRAGEGNGASRRSSSERSGVSAVGGGSNGNTESAETAPLLTSPRGPRLRGEGEGLTTIFFGGGTPSLMPPETVETLLKEAETLFGFAPDIEITLEANPTSVEAHTFADLAQAGINRLSLGVQSLRDDHLKQLGREHSAAEALKALEKAAKAVPRYSFDLIYALPGQSLEEWQQQLEQALTYASGHLSLYQLTLEPGTQFYHLHQSGKLAMPSADDTAAFYETTQTRMEAAQMPAYEISNHAKVGQESRHNLAYWQSRPYLGIGPGAHGRMELPDGSRHATVNLRSPEKWLQQVQNLGHGQESSTSLTKDERLEEAILMGLRLRDGLRAEYLPFLTQPLSSLWPDSLLQGLRDEGLITHTETQLTPTPKGRLLLESLTHKLAMHAQCS